MTSEGSLTFSSPNILGFSFQVFFLGRASHQVQWQWASDIDNYIEYKTQSSDIEIYIAKLIVHIVCLSPTFEGRLTMFMC